MKRKILLTILAFIFAFLGGLGFLMFQERVFQPAVVYETTRVILKGEEVKKEDIKEKKVYGGNANKNELLKPSDIIGKYAKLDFAESETFRTDKLATTFNANEIYKDILRKGESAIAVNTDLRQCVGGLPKAGDRVNVIAVNKDANGKASSAMPILQYVEILSVVNKQADLTYTDDLNKTGKMGVTAYTDKSPHTTVLRVPTEMEAILAIHSEVTLSLVPKDYQHYQPKIVQNVFGSSDAPRQSIPVAAEGGNSQ